MADYKIRLIVEGVDRASGALGGALGSLQRIGEFAAGNLLARGIETAVGGATKLAGAMAGIVVEGGNFEAQLDSIMSKLGGTAGDAAKVRDLIYDLGVDPNLKVSASEAADSIEMLVQNGVSLDAILGGAARSTVLLANATGADFAQAADIATDAMAVFGLGAEDMAGAVDAIAGVTVNSKFDINDYALALAQGGAAASLAGVSLEEFNASVVAMSSFFASGSDAGTSFKTMMQRLVPQTNEAAEAMASLGLNFTNADGSMKSMAEIAGELNRVFEGQVTFTNTVGGRTGEQASELKHLQGVYSRTEQSIRDYQTGVKGATMSDEQRTKKLAELQATLTATEQAMAPLLAITGQQVQTTRALTEEEKIRYLTTIFGADAMRAAAAMATYSEEEFAALQTTLGKSDAELAAAQRMDNLAGDMEIFSGIIETVRLQIGERFQPAARAFVQAAASIAETVSPSLLVFAENMAAAAGPMIDAFQANLSQAIADFQSGLQENKIVLKWSDIFGFSWSQEGGAKLNIGDFIDFSTSGEQTKFQLSDLFGFVSSDGQARKLKIGDFIDYTVAEDDSAFTLRVGRFEWSQDVAPSGDYRINEFRIVGGFEQLSADMANSLASMITPDIFADKHIDLPPIQVQAMWANDALDRLWASAAESLSGMGEALAVNVTAMVQGVVWGPHTNTYSSDAEVVDVNWGNFSHAYQATVDITENITRIITEKYNGSSGGFSDSTGGGRNAGSAPAGGGGSSGFGGGRAIGERNWGGGLVKVHRDEVLAIPRGAHIFTASEARAMAAGGAGGPQITINATVADGLDINMLASRIADVIQMRGR